MTDAPRDFELAWLKEMERRISAGEPIHPREMMVHLRDQLPRGFMPSDVRPEFRLITGPSVEGLKATGDGAKILPDLERAILFIRSRLLEYPLLAKVTASEVAEALDVATPRAERMLTLIGGLGDFLSGASHSDGGCDEIKFGREDNVAAYLGFESLERLLQERTQANAATELSIEERPVVEERRQLGDSAFILMNMDPHDDALIDVSNAIKAECAAFGIEAIRIDDVEHSDQITDRVLSLIADSDLVIADLSGERPNVYYEVGYAHALGKRPILYRKKATRLHFDLAVHNVPEYRNTTELRELLHKRLEAVLGRSATDGSQR